MRKITVEDLKTIHVYYGECLYEIHGIDKKWIIDLFKYFKESYPKRYKEWKALFDQYNEKYDMTDCHIEKEFFRDLYHCEIMSWENDFLENIVVNFASQNQNANMALINILPDNSLKKSNKDIRR